jgi:hypothetical protein
VIPIVFPTHGADSSTNLYPVLLFSKMYFELIRIPTTRLSNKVWAVPLIWNLIAKWKIKFKHLIPIIRILIVLSFNAGISHILESIDHAKYLPQFIEHEIDYQTFLTLEDADLKELGIKALGSRKKILGVIKELVDQEQK